VDGSDEENCRTVQFPDTYEKDKVPELEKSKKRPNPVETHVNILSIDFVDTVSMTVGLSIVLSLTWRDHRLAYNNLLPREGDFQDAVEVTKAERDRMWLPMTGIIHENAILGNIEEDKRSYVNILPRLPAEEMTLASSEENLIYNGSDNDLLMSKQFKMKFCCVFVLVYFPFDDQSCDFIIAMNVKGNTSIALLRTDTSIQYDGPSMLNEFEVLLSVYSSQDTSAGDRPLHEDGQHGKIEDTLYLYNQDVPGVPNPPQHYIQVFCLGLSCHY
jgi:hypothetical protein